MNKLVILFLLFAASAQAATLKDSIGVEKNADRLYILHRVEAKETLFSLSRRYHIPVEEIIAINPQVKDGLKMDALLKIPGAEKDASQGFSKKHIVQPSETLYAIAKKYGVDVEELLSINRIEGNSLKVGQELSIPAESSAPMQPASSDSKLVHMVKGGETLYSLSRTYKVEVDQIKQWNGLADNTLKPGQSLVVGEKKPMVSNENELRQPVGPEPQNTIDSASVDRPDIGFASTENIKRYDIEDNEYLKQKSVEAEPVRIEKVYENGLAEKMEGSDDTKKYLALHKTAPVGSIMQIKNEMNNQSVFVRVIGKLPDTGDNEKISIRISRIAYERLGAIDMRFPVEISYIPK